MSEDIPADMFVTLSPDETASAPATEVAPDWRPIVPVPMDAPRTLPPHRHGKPSSLWTYRDQQGRLLFLVCRFDLSGGDKEMLPLTFC